jgi:bifunctional non-homologous end joining protein LigD
MPPKKSFWNSPSKYGTYEGEKGDPQQWSSIFNFAFQNSDIVNSSINVSAFSVFNLDSSASLYEIKKAFRTKIKQHNQESPDFNRDEFERIVNAYKKLLSLKETPVQNYVKSKKSTDNSDIPKEETVNQDDLIVPQLLTQIDDDELTSYLFNDDFGCQEKIDGKHLTLQIINNQFFVRNKKGISSTLSEFESDLRISNKDLLIDGEQKNSIFYTWDILEYDGQNLRNLPYSKRYEILQSIQFGHSIKIVQLVIKDEKLKLYNNLFDNKKEGIVFKRLNAKFTPGKGDDQFKFKFYSECSVIVVEGRKNKASIGMELIGPNGREFVGYCSCSRKVEIGSIVEIKYLYAYKGGCLYQPAFKEIRDDVDINECTLSQLKYKSEED